MADKFFKIYISVNSIRRVILIVPAHTCQYILIKSKNIAYIWLNNNNNNNNNNNKTIKIVTLMISVLNKITFITL
jgi:hypothetical protein